MCFGQQRLLNINTLSAQALFEDCNWSMNIGSTNVLVFGGGEGDKLTSWLVAQHQFDTVPYPRAFPTPCPLTVNGKSISG